MTNDERRRLDEERVSLPRCVLDHVSLSVSDPVAWARFHGFDDPVASRVLLDRSYLEVVAGSARPLVFVRPDDIHAAAAGLGLGPPEPYAGRDGSWLDVAVPDGPTLTVRTDRPDWPPPRTEPHPNGALSLREVRVAGPASRLDADGIRYVETTTRFELRSLLFDTGLELAVT